MSFLKGHGSISVSLDLFIATSGIVLINVERATNLPLYIKNFEIVALCLTSEHKYKLIFDFAHFATQDAAIYLRAQPTSIANKAFELRFSLGNIVVS